MFREIAIITAAIDGKCYTAELSALEQFHSFSLQQSIATYQKNLAKNTFTINNLSSVQFSTPCFNLLDLPSEVIENKNLLYMIETLLWFFLRHQKVLNPNQAINIKSAQLLTTNFTNTDHVKLKIRPNSKLPKLSPCCYYRLDGNRKYSPQQLTTQLHKIDYDRIEFIEDPFIEKTNYLNSYPFKIALDENLSWGLENNIKFEYAIIKPSLYAISGTIKIIQQVKNNNIIPIISSSYEGYQQHLILEEIVNIFGDPNIHQGLSPKQFIHPCSIPHVTWDDMFISAFWKQRSKNATHIAHHLQIPLHNKKFIGVQTSTPSLQTIEVFFALLMLKKIVIPIIQESSTSLIAPMEYVIDPDKLPLNFSPNNTIIEPINFKQSLFGIFTSGSTGVPKLVLIDLYSMLGSAFSTIEFYNFSNLNFFSQSLPLQHIGGIMIFIRAWLLNAHYSITQVIPPQHLTRTVLSLVPTQIKKYIYDKYWKSVLPKVELVITGGSNLDDKTQEIIIRNKLPVSRSYGMTETIAQITATSPGDLQSNGTTLKGYQIDIINKCIQIKSPFIALGYLKDKKLSSFKHIFSSQDIGEVTPHGLLVRGRKDRIFISGGENISPDKIEQQLLQDPSIIQVVLVNVEDPYFQQVGFLFYEANNLSKQELKSLCKKLLLPHEVPKYFYPFKFDKHKKPKKQELLKLAQTLQTQNKIPKTKPVVIFLHGFMGSSTDWTIITNNLRRHCHCITIDLPGHGNSKAPIDKKHFFRTLHDLIIQEQIVSLVGYSMGGRILLDLLNTQPHLMSYIKACIIESSHPGNLPSNEQYNRQIQDAKLLNDIKDKKSFQQLLRNWYSMPIFGNITTHPHFEELIKSKDISKVNQWQQALNEFSVAKQSNALSLLQKNPNNIFHYIYGELDNKYSLIGKQLPYSHCIDGVGHNTHFQKANEFYNIIKNIILS